MCSKYYVICSVSMLRHTMQLELSTIATSQSYETTTPFQDAVYSHRHKIVIQSSQLAASSYCVVALVSRLSVNSIDYYCYYYYLPPPHYLLPLI